jgi:hypothetical protein
VAAYQNSHTKILAAVQGKAKHMLGWMILFALMAILAPNMTFAGTLAPQMGGFIFALLFFIGLATRLARGRAS